MNVSVSLHQLCIFTGCSCCPHVVRKQFTAGLKDMLTFACAEDGRIDEQQQDVVEEALQHGRLNLGIGQVLTAHCRATDQQGQDLSH